MSCMETTRLGAYVLGAVSASERESIDRHLSDCETCRAELLGLAPLPGLLSRVSVEDVEGPATEAVPAPILPPQPRRNPVRRRAWLLAVAGACLLMLAVVAGGLFLPGSRHPETPATAVVLTGSDNRSGVTGMATASSQAWGTGVRLRLQYVRLNAHCRLVVNARDGGQEVAGSWVATSRLDGTEIPGSSSLSLDDIASMDVYTTTGKRLVHLTRTDATPTETRTGG